MKVIGIGLNKTGTKTLGFYFKQLGLQHKTYDYEAFQLYRRKNIPKLLGIMEDYDSFEDWPWPLFFREIDTHFPDAKFILTIRKTPEIWYRSLCNMAVRMGPFKQYEQYIYGYAMPQGHSQEHIQFYRNHNEAVLKHFKNRPDKLLQVCWENGDSIETLANFLEMPAPNLPKKHINRSNRLCVYSGDNLFLAHINRVIYQTFWRLRHNNRFTKSLKSIVKRDLE